MNTVSTLCSTARHHHSSDDDHPTPPMSTPLLGTDLIALVGLALPVIATVLAEPTRSDVYAVLGAMLAAGLGFIKARAHGKNWLDTSYVVVMRSGLGSILPGALIAAAPLILPASWQDALTKLTWHCYAVLGLFIGLYAEQILSAVQSALPKWLKAKMTPSHD